MEAGVTAGVEAAVFMAVVEAVAVSMAVAAAVFTAAVEASMVADLMAVAIAGFVAAVSMAARVLLAEEVVTKAAGWERAAVRARRENGRRQNDRRQNGRRIFVPRSMMASGILSATRVVPRVPARGAILEARPTTQASPPASPEVPTDVGILLARQAALRNEEESHPISAYPSAGVSVAVVMVGEAVGGVTVGATGGAGEVGASASAGRTGVFIGDRPGRLPGIRGGMALIGMARGRPTLTIRITATTGPTIRLRIDRIHRRIPPTATRRQA